MLTVIMLGCGSSAERRVDVNGKMSFTTERVIGVDIEPRHRPEVLWDLNKTPWPFGSDYADEIHAYEILEHLGRQGDPVSFFETFYQIWRILKPGGYLAATVPHWNSRWAWGDPGHTRVINDGSLSFLDRTTYAREVGKTAMSDYRSIWAGDFRIDGTQEVENTFAFRLQACKPARA